MKILLLNENPIVSRLVSLSAKKMSYDFEELNVYNEDLGYYDVIVVDSDTPAPLKILKEKCERLIFLAPRNQNIDIEAQILQKPFLPTDFLNLLSNKEANELAPEPPVLGSNDNPYADISLDLDNLNLDDLPDENSQNDNLDGLEDLSLDDEIQDNADTVEDENLEQEAIKEQTKEDIETDLDLNLNSDENEDSTQEHTALDTELDLNELEDQDAEDLEIKGNEEKEKQEEIEANISKTQEEFDEVKTLDTQNLEDENLEQEAIKEQTKEDIETDLDLNLNSDENENSTQEHTALDTELDLDENKDAENLEDDKELQTNISDFDNFPVVEEQEKEMDFDDIPEDAEFLGQVKDDEETEEFAPVVEEDIKEEFDNSLSNLSTQDRIKEELAELDELDYGIDVDNGSKVLEDFKDEPILDDNELGMNEDEVVVPNLNTSDFDTLKESDIQEALGEEVLEKDDEFIVSDTTKNDNSEEIVDELSQSIAGAITSSIKDDTLKAALKGMNMNININISFKEN